MTRDNRILWSTLCCLILLVQFLTCYPQDGKQPPSIQMADEYTGPLQKSDSIAVAGILSAIGASHIPVRRIIEVTNGRVTTLFLTNSVNYRDYLINIEYNILPDKIGLLTELRELNASRNSIDSIQDGLFNLKKIEKIDISNNNLHTLDNRFTKLTSLQELIIEINPIEQLPDSINKMVSLTRIRGYGMHLTSIPESFYALPKLTSFSFGSNKITFLSDSVAKLKGTLEGFYMEGNLLTSIPSTICSLEKVTRTSFSCNQINPGSLSSETIRCLSRIDNNWDKQFCNQQQTLTMARTE